jgi:hypothetical protein
VADAAHLQGCPAPTHATANQQDTEPFPTGAFVCRFHPWLQVASPPFQGLPIHAFWGSADRRVTREMVQVGCAVAAKRDTRTHACTCLCQWSYSVNVCMAAIPVPTQPCTAVLTALLHCWTAVLTPPTPLRTGVRSPLAPLPAPAWRAATFGRSTPRTRLHGCRRLLTSCAVCCDHQWDLALEECGAGGEGSTWSCVLLAAQH